LKFTARIASLHRHTPLFDAILLFLIFVWLAAAIPSSATDPDFVWAKVFGGNSERGGNAITADAAGNTYTTGFFRGVADFDPGPGITNLTADDDGDIFVCKLDPDGNLVWAVSMGGVEQDQGLGITIDASANVYVTGLYRMTVDFDPGPGIANLTTVNEFADIFVLKLDPDGNLVWAKSMGGPSPEVGRNIAVDASGNVYTDGDITGTGDYDPGPGVFELVYNGPFTNYISKLDSNGDFVWAKLIGGNLVGQNHVLGIDASANVYSTGDFHGTHDFDPGSGTANLTSVGAADIYLLKLNSDGDFVWAKSMGGPSNDAGRNITTDSLGNTYIGGWFNDTVDLDPGAGVAEFTSAGSFDHFVVKFNSAGNLVWATTYGGPDFERTSGIAVDPSNNVFITGSFLGTTDLHPGPEVNNFTSAGDEDLFVLKLDSVGNFEWAISSGGPDDDRGAGIATDSMGNAYTTGHYVGPIDFDPGPGTEILSNGGVFVTKFASPPKVVTVGRTTWPVTQSTPPALFDVTFSQLVTGVDAADFVVDASGVTGAIVTGVTGNGRAYTVTVDSFTGSGQLSIDIIDDDSIINSNSVPLGGIGTSNGDFIDGSSYFIGLDPPMPVGTIQLTLILVTLLLIGGGSIVVSRRRL
jgi:hypothetical protein